MLYPSMHYSIYCPPCGYSVEAGTDVEGVAMRTPEKQVLMRSSLQDKKSTLADATG